MPRPKDLIDEGGSVYPEGDGYRAALVIDGKTVRRRAKTERAAHAKLRELIKLRDAGVIPGTGKMKLSAWLEQWYSILARAKCKPKTIAGHRDICKYYVIPYLGDKAINAIKPPDLDTWLDQLGKLELSAWTIHGAFRRLRAALNIAVKRGMIARNPCLQVEEPPKPGGRREEVLDIPQLMCLLNELRAHRLYAAFAVLGTLGLRPSELIGLRVGSLTLDGDDSALVVCEQLQRFTGPDGKQVLHRERSTKSGREDEPEARSIPLSPELVPILRAHLTAMKAERLKRGERPIELDPDDLVFTTKNGTPIDDRNLLETLHRACKRAGVPEVSLHSLRHTAGSVMLAQGQQIVDVSAVLGHANPAITARIYAHSFEAGKRSAVNAASAVLLRRA